MVKKMMLTVLLTLALLPSLLTLCHTETAYADTADWARIIEDDTNLYATEDCTKVMFVLEKSYYVRILSESGGILMVSVMQNETDFPEIIGYVRKSEIELTLVDPIMPYYPTEKLTVTSDSATLRLSPLTSAETVRVATNTQKLSYYGKIEYYGKSWYYVCYVGKFGYVEVGSVSAPNIPLHPTPLRNEIPSVPSVPSTTIPSDDDPTKNAMPTSEILLMVFVILLAVGLTLALFLPGNIKKKDSVFEQDI